MNPRRSIFPSSASGGAGFYGRPAELDALTAAEAVQALEAAERAGCRAKMRELRQKIARGKAAFEIMTVTAAIAAAFAGGTFSQEEHDELRALFEPGAGDEDARWLRWRELRQRDSAWRSNVLAAVYRFYWAPGEFSSAIAAAAIAALAASDQLKCQECRDHGMVWSGEYMSAGGLMAGMMIPCPECGEELIEYVKRLRKQQRNIIIIKRD